MLHIFEHARATVLVVRIGRKEDGEPAHHGPRLDDLLSALIAEGFYSHFSPTPAQGFRSTGPEG